MKNLLISIPDQKSISIQYLPTTALTFNLINQYLFERLPFLVQIKYSLVNNGKSANINEKQQLNFEDGHSLRVQFHLQGGKGGFASLLRSQAVKRRKITNFDASRDLQGRRIRNIQNEQTYIEFLKKKKEEDIKVNKAMNEYKKIEATLKEGQLNYKLNEKYKKKLDELEEKVCESVQYGIKRKRQEMQTIKLIQDRLDYLQNAENPENNIDSGDNITKALIVEKNENLNQVQSIEKQAEQDEEKPDTIELQDYKAKKFEEEKTQVQDNFMAKTLQSVDISQYDTLEQFMELDDTLLKKELGRLGLKVGGHHEDRAKRLFDIKEDPSLVFDRRYIAKTKK